MVRRLFLFFGCVALCFGALWGGLRVPFLTLTITASLVAAANTLLDRNTDRRKRVLASVAAALGIVGAVYTWRAGVHSAAEFRKNNEELARRETEIATLSRESRDLARANAELGRALAQRSDQIAVLSRQAIANVTGGDSFCYLDLSYLNGPSPLPALITGGDNPVYDLQVRIVDLELSDRIEKEREAAGRPLTFNTFSAAERVVKLTDTIPPHAYRLLQEVSWPTLTGDAKSYNIFFFARNGEYIEQLRLRRVAGSWARALRVYKVLPGKRGIKQLMEPRVEAAFPRNAAGKIDW
jgi:cell division protein FtsB